MQKLPLQSHNLFPEKWISQKKNEKRKIVCLLLSNYTIMFIFNPYLLEYISTKSRPLFNIHELRSISILSWCSL